MHACNGHSHKTGTYIYAYMNILFVGLFRIASNHYVFLLQLIRRRYFSDDLPAQNPWSSSLVERPIQRLDENSSDDDQTYKNTRYLRNSHLFVAVNFVNLH